MSIDRATLLELFARFESRIEREHPSTPYREILKTVHGLIAVELGVGSGAAAARSFAASVAASVGDWPAFPDTCAALGALGRHHKLVIVSNVDRISFAGTARRLGVDFDAVITAEKVGAYKPDHRMFQLAFDVLEGMGVERHRILHVAQSLFHDHVPAQALGMKTVWINRLGGAGRAIGWERVRGRHCRRPRTCAPISHSGVWPSW